ncbi:hypothetical protein LEP3755_34220 [Leptolyngbya sp. NIES-3755]|nr:hypothetical protein LEP3755_34220 [Leptolyngbya sp. NIES-3755]
MLDEQIINQIREQVDSEFEICGVVIQDELYVSKNVSPEPRLNAAYDSETIDRIQLALKNHRKPTLFHTHTRHSKLDDFSVQDIKSSRAWKLPSFLLHVPSGIPRYYDPLEVKPLLGREWHWSYQNCYTLAQDYYRSLGIQLSDFYLESPDEFNDPRFNRFAENVLAQGFRRLRPNEALQESDFLLFNLVGLNPNHCGVFLAPERNRFLHQLVNRLSKESIYGSEYRNLTHSVYRHRTLDDAN